MDGVGRDRTGEMYKYIGEVMKKYHGSTEEENHLGESGMTLEEEEFEMGL